ncbi:MAG: hypothetical protein REI11_18110 [Patulibacter sp.]|nr:hypothetical protein [Patulibacter sp.]
MALVQRWVTDPDAGELQATSIAVSASEVKRHRRAVLCIEIEGVRNIGADHARMGRDLQRAAAAAHRQDLRGVQRRRERPA